MSAKEGSKRSTFHIETLPDELLNEILRHATWVPYGIEPSDLVVKNLQSTEVAWVKKEYRRSLVTKRYLVRVAKRWYRLAYLFLYEWILVARVKNLRGLVRAVEQLSQGSGISTDSAYVGWFTKRLDIAFHWTGQETVNERDDIGPLLLRLLQILNNLEVLTVGECEGYQVFMDSSVSDSWCPRLQFLNWTNTTYRPDDDVWQHFVHSHPDLIGANPCEAIHYRYGREPPEGDPFTHPRLLTWTTSYYTPIPIANTFTSLRRLSLNLYRYQALDTEHVESFISCAMPLLTVLQLNLAEYSIWPISDFEIDSMFNSVQSLYRFMPNLRRVELIFHTLPFSWSGFRVPNTVAELGIRVCLVRQKRRVVRELMRVLNDIVQKADRTPTVQFLDEGTVNGILVHEEYLARHVKEWNILEKWFDHEGNEYNLHDRFPLLS